MEFLSLAEAWRWIQIGFCMAVGGGIIILGVLGAMMGSSSGAATSSGPRRKMRSKTRSTRKSARGRSRSRRPSRSSRPTGFGTTGTMC